MKVRITVKPGSKKGPLIQEGPIGDLLIFVREPAQDGQANAAVIRLVADHYNVPKSYVSILKGTTSTHKVCEIRTRE